MTILFLLLNVSLVITVGALAMVLWNLCLYLPVREQGEPRDHDYAAERITVCIPARDEEANLEPCVRSILENDYPDIEVLVYDDHSTDRTAEVLQRLCNEDPRVRRVPTRPLPEGWNGKQFGCDQMGRSATGKWLLFTDADVRFAPSALHSARVAACDLNADLVSTFPRQMTGTFGEMLIVPMIFFILFSYLPMVRMRRTADPNASAGCGQFLFVRAEAWHESGGHEAFRNSMHDGIMLPRALRRHGFHTDLFDGTDIVHVRMYRGFAATWRGFAKNAYEGLGSIALLIVLTVMHLIGHVLPWVLIIPAIMLLNDVPMLAVLCGMAIALQITLRVKLASRFHQPRAIAMLHGVSVLLMTMIQWHSWWLHRRGRRTWRGREWQTKSAQAA